jgi:hypothetical protein
MRKNAGSFQMPHPVTKLDGKAQYLEQVFRQSFCANPRGKVSAIDVFQEQKWPNQAADAFFSMTFDYVKAYGKVGLDHIWMSREFYPSRSLFLKSFKKRLMPFPHVRPKPLHRQPAF